MSFAVGVKVVEAVGRDEKVHLVAVSRTTMDKREIARVQEVADEEACQMEMVGGRSREVAS